MRWHILTALFALLALVVGSGDAHLILYDGQEDLAVFSTADYLQAYQTYYARNGTIYIPSFRLASENDTELVGPEVGRCRLVPPNELNNATREQLGNRSKWTIALIPSALASTETVTRADEFAVPEECLGYRRLAATMMAGAGAFTAAGYPPLGGIVFISPAQSIPGGPEDPYCLTVATNQTDHNCNVPPVAFGAEDTPEQDRIPLAFMARKDTDTLYEHLGRHNPNLTVILAQESGLWNEYYESTGYAVRIWTSFTLRLLLTLYAAYRIGRLYSTSISVVSARMAAAILCFSSLIVGFTGHFDSLLFNVHKITFFASELVLIAAATIMLGVWAKIAYFCRASARLGFAAGLVIHGVMFATGGIWLLVDAGAFFKIGVALIIVRSVALALMLVSFAYIALAFFKERHSMDITTHEYSVLVGFLYLAASAIAAWTVLVARDITLPQARNNPSVVVTLACCGDAADILLYTLFLIGVTGSPRGKDRKQEKRGLTELRPGWCCTSAASANTFSTPVDPRGEKYLSTECTSATTDDSIITFHLPQVPLTSLQEMCADAGGDAWHSRLAPSSRASSLLRLDRYSASATQIPSINVEKVRKDGVWA
ncbi:hypothetical protein THASP1DRAFT_32251 [Thamnocephalis sphaerospora]|uniref:Lung seven transmembrane receptor-domain-containing protein n=1 Tax=Thamnocephalis sphaerospora TaxID=78915 RepID=A0A4P9XKH6_9FUNG|nr:hypothetical protein THASP1DRAFT_32251 [Thamnocephalis sphaerospora]|eukprot:RKP05921.1 hypothetical protein THASP1DRAFT_32251 [Thamnocephalis sphaerospora]